MLYTFLVSASDTHPNYPVFHLFSHLISGEHCDVLAVVHTLYSATSPESPPSWIQETLILDERVSIHIQTGLGHLPQVLKWARAVILNPGCTLGECF